MICVWPMIWSKRCLLALHCTKFYVEPALCHHVWVPFAAARASPALMRSPAAFAEAAAALKRRRAELAAAQPQQRPAASSSQSVIHPQAVSKRIPSAHPLPTAQSHLAQADQPESAVAPGAVPAAQSGASSIARDSETAEPQQAAGAKEMPTAAAPGASSRATDSAAASQPQQPGVRTRSSARANAETTAAEVPCSADTGAHRTATVDDPLTQPAANQSSEKASTSQC